MQTDSDDKNRAFRLAWRLIAEDDSVPPEEKQALLKIFEALIKAAELTGGSFDGEAAAREILSKHALITLIKQQAEELETLKQLSVNLTSSLDLTTVLDSVVAEAMRLVKRSRAAHIYLHSEGGLRFGASLNAQGERNKPIFEPRPNGITQTAIRTGEVQIIEDMAKHPLYPNLPPNLAGSIISLPLKAGGETLGVMNLSRSVVGSFPASELRLLELLADHAALAIANARLHTVVKELANKDSVTGLPNRRALDERLLEEIRNARQNNSEFAVVMMDLDGFKAVNDRFGHAVGDDLLYALFNHLAAHMREGDFLARYGGDELTLVICDAGLEEAEAVTRKVIALVKRFQYPFPGGAEVEIGVTAGIAIYPRHTRIPGDLLRSADAALYQGKKHQRGGYVVAKISTGPLNEVTLVRRKQSD